MKFIRRTFILLTAVVLAACWSSCEKGKDSIEPGFGKLILRSTFDSDAKPFLIKVDDETKDTLTFLNSGSKDIVLAAGNHKVKIVNIENNKTLIDTTILIETRKINSFARFWYHKSLLVFSDYNPVTMPKPAPGNVYSVLLRQPKNCRKT